MSDQENLSSVGRSVLKDILTVRDLLDYRAALEKKAGSPLAEETIADIKDPGKGWVFALGALVDRFNESPADAAAAAKLFGLKLDPADPRIKAFQFSGTVLNKLDSAADLKTALERLESRAGRTISKQGQALLKQILYLRDFLDYFKFLLAGDKKNGRPSPLSAELLGGFRRLINGPAAFGRLVEQFNADPSDVKLALKLFGLKARAGVPVKARDFAFAGAVFRITEHSAILKNNLCKIDKAECPAVQPAPAEPPGTPSIPSPKPETAPAPEPAKPAAPQPAATSADNQKQIALIRQSLLNGDLPAAIKARKKIVPVGLAKTDEQLARDFDSGIVWLSRAAAQAKKGDQVGAKADYMAARLMLPVEADGLIGKKLAELEKLGAPAAAAPIRRTLKLLPEDKPEKVAEDLERELKVKFAQRAEDPQVRNFGASKIRVKITATLDPDGAAAAFRATIIVKSYENDILKVITPCTTRYSLPPGYTAAQLDAFLSEVQKQADANTFTITPGSSAD